jgi:hypothetical protein
MKTHIVILALVAFALGACGGAVPTPSAEEALVDFYTAVAMTIDVRSNSVSIQSTSGPVPSFTSTIAYPTPTPTAIPTSTVSSYVIASGCYSAAYVSDVTIPDGTTLVPGEAFTKTWKFQNTGTCAWTDYFEITFISETGMDGEATIIDQYVSPGSVANVSVDLIAPKAEGEYTGYWQLTDEAGTIFGESVYVEIIVSGDAVTPTTTTEPTLTPAIESTSMPALTSTPTETPTDTLAPTEILTDNPLPTGTQAVQSTDQ